MTDETLAGRIDGERGDAVLLLNGGLMSIAAWEAIAAPLAVHHRVVRCDLRGQLLSPGTAPPDLAGNVPDVLRLLDRFELDRVHVVGTSYGGEVAVLLAAEAPERVRSLIGVTVADRATESIRSGSREVIDLLEPPFTPGLKRRIYDRLVEEVFSARHRAERADDLEARRAQIERLPDRWFLDLAGILDAVSRLDVRDRLASVACPTLIVIAADDRIIPPAASRALARGIVGAEIEVHAESGHALVAEDPEWVVDVCLDFLARHGDSSS